MQGLATEVIARQVRLLIGRDQADQNNARSRECIVQIVHRLELGDIFQRVRELVKDGVVC